MLTITLNDHKVVHELTKRIAAHLTVAATIPYAVRDQSDAIATAVGIVVEFLDEARVEEVVDGDVLCEYIGVGLYDLAKVVLPEAPEEPHGPGMGATGPEPGTPEFATALPWTTEA